MMKKTRSGQPYSRNTLQPQRQPPRQLGSLILRSRIRHARRENRSRIKKRIIIPRHSRPPLRRSQLNRIRRSSRCSQGNSKSQHKSPPEEICLRLSCRHYNCSNHENHRSHAHARSPSADVDDGAGENGSDHAADGVDGENDSGGSSGFFFVEVFFILVHGVDGTEDGAIEARSGRIETCGQEDEVELEGSLG